LIPGGDHASPLPEGVEENTHDEPRPDIQLLGVAAFGHIPASEKVVQAFAIRLGEFQGLLGASLEGITEGVGHPSMLNAQAGAAAGIAAAETDSDGARKTATGSPRLVLTTGPNCRVSSGSGSDPEMNRCNGSYHTKTRTVAIGLVLPLKTWHYNSTILAPISVSNGSG
jgi:hypothetical protein